ncbi:MAG: PQQ-binding-like beta-propeller repeat protein [Kiritimatiellaeota bacterium]|nr:PQQ-binding-like beta-propeller repeat protein [Kiritimatiellota bacterium]
MQITIAQRVLRRVRSFWLYASPLLVAAFAGPVHGEDWPTYRHDIARSGITSERLSLPLSPQWIFEPAHAPEPAWDKSNPRPVGGWYGLTEGPRTRFDDAYQVAVAGNSVYFGSSATGKINALDLNSGKLIWGRFTGGPVRLAPTIWQGKVYAGSDDGFVYCLDGRDGREVWKISATLGRRLLLGNGRMISLWPVRSGILVDNGTAYFGAGLFPEEGVVMHAVRADTGKTIWRNDTCAGVGPSSRFSPQGYLLASKTRLYVPQGRVPPAALDRATGKVAFQTFVNHRIGGTYALLAGGRLYTGTDEIVAMNENLPGDRLAWFWGRQLLVKDKTAYLAGNGEIKAIDRVRQGKASLQRAALLDQLPGVQRNLRTARRRKDEAAIAANEKQLKQLQERKARLERELAAAVLWRTPSDCEDAMIMAGSAIFVGGAGKVEAIDSASGKKLWTGTVPGRAKGLAAANGRLIVSTDTGALVCFGAGKSGPVRYVRQAPRPDPYPTDRLSPVYAAAARTALDLSGARKGYCLVLGAETGRLAYEIARRSELHVIGIEPDPDKVERARRALDAAGVYGDRVTILRGPLRDVPFSDYFANLIVSDTILLRGLGEKGADGAPAPAELYRLLKPLGGAAVIGLPDGAPAAGRLDSPGLRTWLSGAGPGKVEIVKQNGLWGRIVRGPLAGAGSWTHEYANPGNTTCSDDRLVRGPLGLLWFGDPGPYNAVDRHARVVAPVSINGRFFREGYNVVTAYDAYNGVRLWRRNLPGVTRRGASYRASNMVAGPDSLFLAIGGECLRLNAETGKTLVRLKAPPGDDGKPRQWGYLALANNLVYGSRSLNPRAADAVFAVDPETGKRVWLHRARNVADSSISIDAGRFLFVDMTVAPQERNKALAARAATAAKLEGEARRTAEAELKSATVYAVNALDAKTGKLLWRRPMDLTGCALPGHYVTLGTMATRGVLLIFGVYTDGHYWKEFYAGQFNKRRVVALSVQDGRVLWSQRIGYRVRPVVIERTLYAEPWAYDLLTGRQKKRLDPVSGKPAPWQFARPGHHCGCPAAAPNMLFFRSYCLAWYDLNADYGTTHFGGQRTGCWINFIPANGLLVVPEASSGCLCPFPLQTTLVFKHMAGKQQPWAFYSSPGPTKPVRNLALNLGAPGDRKDHEGRLWLGFPRPRGALVYTFPASISFYPGGGYYRSRPETVKIDRTDTPWLFASGARRIRRFEVPLLGEADGPSLYRVVLGFADTAADAAPDRRVFDIKLQGKTALAAFDPFRAAGGADRAATKTFEDIPVQDKMVVEFVSKNGGNPPAGAAPILQFLRIERTRVLSVGMAAPDYLLSDAKPKQTGAVRLANDTGRPFKGSLRIVAPPGLAAYPAEKALEIDSGGRISVPVELRVVRAGKPGNLKVRFSLVRADGTVEIARQTRIEYLGPLDRLVVRATEDAFVRQKQPTTNLGKQGVLSVDGGAAKMGDRDHSLAYIRFRFDPFHGVTKSVKLRLQVSENPGAESGDAGRICRVDGPWQESTLTYSNRPKPGPELGRIGRVGRGQRVEIPLKVDLSGKSELSIVLDPLSCDGTAYGSREGGRPPVLVIDYKPQPQAAP